MDISLTLKRLDESEFSFNYGYDYDNLNKTEICFSFSNDFQISRNEESIIVLLNVSITSSEDKDVLVKNGVRAVIKVEPFADLVNPVDEKVFTVNAPGLMETFVSIAVGAVRGFLAKNLKGTPLDGIVLPLIPITDIKKILKVRAEKDS